MARDPRLTSVLLLAYRRPNTTARVLEALRVVQPRRLFVACDGPRPDDAAELQACAATRQLIETAIDWPCELTLLLREENRGCRRGVSEAIDWFFAQVEEGIVLEDDIVASPAFFAFCSELLERYRDDRRVGVISGSNFQPQRPRDGASYYFSIYNHCWGWASWRRAWAAYDADLQGWPAFRDQGWLEDLGGRRFARYWTSCLERVHRGDCDTWDYIWPCSCRAGARPPPSAGTPSPPPSCSAASSAGGRRRRPTAPPWRPCPTRPGSRRCYSAMRAWACSAASGWPTASATPPTGCGARA
ncbi:glycosyltransferase family 2 protein [Synechococcus sp. CBW1004]|uniref:glycosyltransferase family 2 protein n=1 Tax=Synechococcus sp. CBW1004 TaxID=1353136 RepID=UPI0018CC9B19|nr:glycosyltransferase family 2 protein [Synechococcus sp. CBW1004]QPN64388.1 glycosyltransferase family 2 protein [Synechococcus sp. CBW1004]